MKKPHSFYQDLVDDRFSERDVETILARLSFVVGEADRANREDEFGAWPHVLHVDREGSFHTPLRVGERYRITGYEKKKWTGDFEIQRIRPRYDRARDEHLDDHIVYLRRVLETTVSRASDNQITLPASAFREGVSTPWPYNRALATILPVFLSQQYDREVREVSEPSEKVALAPSPDAACPGTS